MPPTVEKSVAPWLEKAVQPDSNAIYNPAAGMGKAQIICVSAMAILHVVCLHKQGFRIIATYGGSRVSSTGYNGCPMVSRFLRRPLATCRADATVRELDFRDLVQPLCTLIIEKNSCLIVHSEEIGAAPISTPVSWSHPLAMAMAIAMAMARADRQKHWRTSGSGLFSGIKNRLANCTNKEQCLLSRIVRRMSCR
ncbi:MAG: hypothetical protein V5B40_10860 [Candidatus Accumulibacter meliphilus]|jgi:hypothetical protein|uniref:hypothetical protein n=1 Tax=Candidatus Accumulibacter meliphilus TaxID=2211374 RepID=UPI002FC29EF2